MAVLHLNIIILCLLVGTYGQGVNRPPCHYSGHQQQEEPVQEDETHVQDSLDKIYVQCGSIGCIRARFLNLIDEYDSKSSLPIVDGLLSIEHTDASTAATTASIDSKSQLDKMISRVDRYLRTHSLRINLPRFSMGVARSMDTSNSRHFDLSLGLLTPTQGRNNKLRKYLLPLMLALQIKMIFALPLFLFISAALGLKSFSTSMMAMVFSGAALLRSLLGGGGRGNGGASSRVSYEVKQPPVAAAAATFNQAPLTPDIFYPYSQYYPAAPTALSARTPEYKIYTTASNAQR